MNERITELLKQAALDTDNGPNSEYHSPTLERFAELIIEDVLAIIADPKNYNRCVFTSFDQGRGACIADELTKQINQQLKDKK